MSLRRPTPQYLASNRNGFDESTKRFPTEILSEAEATEAQDIARFVIREMGSFFPSLAEMKDEIATPETVDSLTERIKRLKKEHQENMAKLSRYYAQELDDDALDRYFQTDDIKYFDFEDFSKSGRDEWAEHYARLEEFFRRNDKAVASEHSDLVARMTYEHLRELLPLYRRRRELERQQDDTTRIRQQTQFPQTVHDYRELSQKANGKSAQLAVAKFLTGEEPMREQLRTRCRWTRTQTEPLMAEYNRNPTFRTEVAGLVSAKESWDPRMRRL